MEAIKKKMAMLKEEKEAAIEELEEVKADKKAQDDKITEVRFC